MDRAQLELARKDYLTHTFLIEQMSRRHGVTPIFVWQPVPGYKYDLKHHPFGYQGEMKDAQEKFYPMMRRVFEHELSSPNYLWCGDIQQDRAEPLYVDSAHYTAAFSTDFAESIVRGCLERHLLDKHLGPMRPSEPAGRTNSLHQANDAVGLSSDSCWITSFDASVPTQRESPITALLNNSQIRGKVL